MYKMYVIQLGMQQKTILGVIVVTVLAFAFIAWKLNAPKIAQSPSEQATSTADPAVLAKLQADLQTVAPHFIDASKGNGQTLTPEEQKIKDDVVALFLVANSANNRDYYSNLWLNAVGKRYILATQPSSGSSYDEIIDSQTGKVTPIPGEARYYLASEGRNVALYVDTQAIHIYTLDQADAILVSGSQLSGTETYHSGTSDFQIAPVQTHTKNSITISVFDSSQIVKNPDAQPNEMQTMNMKIRDLTLSF